MATEKVVPIKNEEEKEEKVNPIILEIPDEGEVFTLEFSRESVKFAENHGFVIEDVGKYGMSGTEDIFYYAFRMHHPRMTKNQTDDILYNKMHGLPEGMLTRLGQLYAVPFNALIKKDDEAKNSKQTVIVKM